MSDAVIDAWGVDETQHAIVESWVDGLSAGPWDVRWIRRGKRVLLEVWEERRRVEVAEGVWKVIAYPGLVGVTYPSLDAAKAAVGYFAECGVTRSASR